MAKKTLSPNLFYWLQIEEGLTKEQVEEIASSNQIALLEQACTIITSVKEKQYSLPNHQSKLKIAWVN